ncbi:MAG: hypothetical protein S4CHLAM6_05920 [Chlamydiae bacterium]|nr:hypothetical protein [Chlamydiota bacterium]
MRVKNSDPSSTISWWNLSSIPDQNLSDEQIKIKNLFLKTSFVKPFDWMNWSTLNDYFADNSIVDLLPEEDVLKIALAFQRADRFAEGTMECAIEDGTMLKLANRIEELKDK